MIRFAACLVAAVSLAWATPGATGASERLRVVATTSMIADAAREIGGERVEVIGLMGEGVDPHLYSPTRSDIVDIMRADVVFYNGLLLEGRMVDALIRAATAGRRVHAVTEGLAESALLESDEDEGLTDPHVWMDPRLWTHAVGVVRDRLVEADPGGEAAYRERAVGYLERIAELDAYAEKVLATVPERARVLVTAHDAFGYFGARYGFEVEGIQGMSTESQAGVRDIERIVSMVVDRGVRAVFVETTVPDRNVRAIIQGARARGHEVAIGGELFSDAMGPGGTYEGTYIGMIDHNVTTIVRALGGEAPSGGMAGRLGGGR